MPPRKQPVQDVDEDEEAAPSAKRRKTSVIAPPASPARQPKPTLAAWKPATRLQSHQLQQLQQEIDAASHAQIRSVAMPDTTRIRIRSHSSAASATSPVLLAFSSSSDSIWTQMPRVQESLTASRLHPPPLLSHTLPMKSRTQPWQAPPLTQCYLSTRSRSTQVPITHPLPLMPLALQHARTWSTSGIQSR
jgi:hypothetical protein